MIRRKLSGIKRIGRWVRSRFTGRGLVLLYHRVADPALEDVPDPFSLCITPQHFAEHLEVLRKSFSPIGLQEMAAGIRENNLPPKAVAVTFDDGYADNLSNAKPLLKKFTIPATIFVISGALDQYFWWDQLTRVIFQPAHLPQNLAIEIPGHRFDATLQSDDEPERNQLLRKLHRFMRLLTPEEIEAMLSALACWSNYSHQEDLISRPLTTAELRKLAGDELITVGSHTITHPPLKMIPLAQQETEIKRSKADLENIIHQPATSFSYPFGLSTDYSTLSVNLVRDAGYILACTNEMDAVWYGSDPFQLPRLWAKDLSGEAFAHYLNKWLM